MGDSAKSLIASYLKGGKQRVLWNGALSEELEVKFGVRQGSVLGPLLFILLTSDLPSSMSTADQSDASVSLYADDTSDMVTATTWEEVNNSMTTRAIELEDYSRTNGLHLNAAKTQVLKLGHPDTPSTTTMTLLGVSIDKNLGFGSHHSAVLLDIRRRIGIIRRLKTSISRGPLLTEVARSLVVGKLQSSAWITRRARISDGACGSTCQTQIALNDLSRVLLGVRRADKIRITELTDRAALPTVNEVVVKQAALAAWKAVNRKGNPLRGTLIEFDSRTRGAAEGLRRPISTKCNPVSNMSNVWNASAELRMATNLTGAKKAANILARTVRFL